MSRPPLLDRREIGRRTRIALGRGRATLSGGLTRPCVFLHLPKCGGTSLTAALAACVGATRRIGAIDALATRRAAAVAYDGRDCLSACHEDLDQGHRTFALREHVLLTHLAQGCHLIHGHFFYSQTAIDALFDDHGLVTVMRDPTARALSNYRMAVRAGIVADDVDAWLDSDVGRRMAQAATRYLSGENTILDQDAALVRAKTALAHFDVVGVLEDLPNFLDDFANKFGPRLRLPRLNRGVGETVKLNTAQQARLHELTASDRVLYGLARQRRGVSRQTGPEPTRTLAHTQTP